MEPLVSGSPASAASLLAFSLTMSQLETLENVPALEHEHKVLASNLDNKTLNGASVQVNVSIPVVDNELEPIVTRKELWSYYRTSLREIPRSCEGIERLSSLLQWR